MADLKRVVGAWLFKRYVVGPLDTFVVSLGIFFSCKAFNYAIGYEAIHPDIFTVILDKIAYVGGWVSGLSAIGVVVAVVTKPFVPSFKLLVKVVRDVLSKLG